MEFLSWHYSRGVDYYLKSWFSTIRWVQHYFSPLLLLETLFSPWKRLYVHDQTSGFNLQKKFEAFTFNIISIWVGATVRLILFFVALILIVLAYLAGSVGMVFWLVIPFFSLGIYSKYKRQTKNYIQDLVFRLKSSKSQPLEVIFGSEAGVFVLAHTGLAQEDVIKDAKIEGVNFDNFKAQTFQDVITNFIKNKVWSDQFFNKHEIQVDDLVLAANWWDERQDEKTTLGDSDMGRPGLALELTFGYTPTLDQYSVDLSVPQSYSHRLIGRHELVSRMERILSSGSSILLTGQPGVGKKTVVLEFARRAVSGELGKAMSFKRVLEFDYNALLSGALDLNQKKTQLAYILGEASSAGNIILMIRDIQRLTNSEVEGYDFTDIFEEYLEKRVLKVIAVSTNSEYERFIAPNLRLRKYLEKVEVVPPEKDHAFQILIEAAKRWEAISNFTIGIPALRHILEESDRYITEVPFPEKALELLDAVVSYKQSLAESRLGKQSLAEQVGKEQVGGNTITVDDTNAVLAEKTGVSFARLTSKEKEKLGNIEEIIHQRLIDQDAAVSLIGKTLRSKTVGVVKETRPLGSFLFLGPTGVGKTETAKVLAKVYYGSEEHILRFDMAEYSGGEGLERLIGSVSKNIPGSLTTAIKNKPASLLLLDEIEKASSEIYNLFLSLLDEGVITDAFGKKILCRNLFVIGTSNAGAEYIRGVVNRNVKGSELQNSVVNYVMQKDIFSPEFINRFDGVVVYEPLGKGDLEKIAKLMLSDLVENLKKKNIQLTYTDETVKKLAEDGFDPAFGARPMRRIVNITLGDLIGRSILSGEIQGGETIKLLPGKNKEEFSFEKMI